MDRDRLAELRIEGFRTIDRLILPLDGLVVLIGENGTGKSTILEACEILRRMAGSQFMQELYGIHRAPAGLLRHGVQELTLGVRVEGDGPPLRYDLTLGSTETSGLSIVAEALEIEPSPGQAEPLRLISRSRSSAEVLVDGSGPKPVSVAPDHLLLVEAGRFVHPGINRMTGALSRIDVHLPFNVLASWASRAHTISADARASATLRRVDRLDRLGRNLANAFAALRSELGDRHWEDTMEYVRLGLGDRVETVTTRAEPGEGAVGLWVKMRNDDDLIPASALADGFIAYLCFVALFRLDPGRTLLAFDEPELHLHPGLLVRILGFFEAIAEECPVLLATHSDRLLDVLQEPARSVRVCDLDERDGATRLRRLDPAALESWLADYRGLGDLRSAGYLGSVLSEREPAGAGDTDRWTPARSGCSRSSGLGP